MLKLINLLILLAGISFAQSPFLTLMEDDGITYEAETLAYQLRVEADGGEIINLDDVNNFYLDAKANNYLDTLICALLYTGGIKKSNDSVVTWYDLTSNENDFSRTATTTSPGYSAIDGVGGKTIPTLQSTLTYNQPTAYYSIMKRSGATSGYFWGSTSDHGLLQLSAGSGFYLYAGSDFISSIGNTVGQFELCRIIYAGSSSSVQIDNGSADVGNAGSQNLSSSAFQLFRENGNTYFKCFVIVPRLSATKDLALKNILNTIYPTY